MASFIGETNFLPGTTGKDGIRLGCGAPVDAKTTKTGVVTVAIRPEQVRIVATSDAGAIPATVENLVYFGTDTHYHMVLSDGAAVVARLQSGTGEDALRPGSTVGLQIAPGAAQVLED